MRVRIFFSRAQKTAAKFAEFESVELKNQFVTALNKDPVCVRKYKVYSNASSLERKEAALEVDVAQYQFYKRWALEHKL